jgi:hypothetical protein
VRLKFCLLLFVLLVSCQNSEDTFMSPELNEFPSIQGNNLNKEKKVVPDDFVDKNLVVIVAFQQWHQSLVDESILLLEENGLGETHNIIEVPTVQKTNKLAEIYLDGIMRAGIRDDRIRNRTITAYLDKNQFLEILDIPSDETIYWFLIEKNSKDILARGYGIIAEKDLDLINSF